MVLILFLALQDSRAELQEKVAKQLRNQATVRVSIGEFLAGAQMHEWAQREYRRACELDPGCEAAWTKRGYRKVDGKWEFDGTHPVPTKNKKTGAEGEKLRKEYQKKLDSMGADFAQRFARLAEEAEKAGLKEEAAAAWRRSLECDPTNERARKALGYEKLPSGGWATPDEKRLLEEIRSGLASAPTGSAMTEETAFEKALKFPLTKRQADHFVALSPHLPDATLQAFVRYGEHTIATWRKLFGADAFGKTKVYFLVFEKKEQHEAYIDAYHHGTRQEKDHAKKTSGQLGFPTTECWQGAHTQDSIEDYCVHATAQNLMRIFAVGKRTKTHDPIWITEGTAYWFTRSVHNSARWGCVELSSTGTGEEKDPRKPEGWPRLVRAAVVEERDPHIHGVLKCLNYQELSTMETIKAWSLVDFLLLEHRAKFVEFCKDLRGAEDNGEKSLAKVFGWTIEELDAKWREWVAVAYAGR
ncbi:MAG: hypothetical protein HYY17_08235 [Planctomycetes bacterium]|nr:hypothetical protein [Planctomycetota bacterium]